MKQFLEQIAEQLDSAAHKAAATSQISLETDISLQDAYDIQKLSINRRLERGESMTGYKLGFTSRAKMEQMGVHDIIWGRLTDGMQYYYNGALSADTFIHPRAEPEIAFKLKWDIDKLISIEDVPEYIEAVAGAIEIIDSRYENFKFSLEDVVADNCSSSGYVVGRWMDPKTRVDDLGIKFLVNGKEVNTGNTNAILGNPIESLVELSKMAVKYNQKIEAGSIILAGAATAAQYIHSGDQIEAQFDNLGSVKINVS
jgi:2-oxo-3-hexenedioate decarboxylase